MEQTKEELENIKAKLIEHISKTYEKSQAEELIENIKSMKDEEFIDFLKEQGLIGGKNKKDSCLFCSIVFGDIPSTKIGENEKGIAILDINPASLGHSLIIPKEHIESKESLSKEVEKLALIVKEKLEKVFEPKRIDLIPLNIMGHEVINVLPVYKNESMDSERKKMNPKELEKIKEKIGKIEIKKDEEKIEKKEKAEITEKNTWLPKRIP